MTKDNRYVDRQLIAGGRFSSVFRARDSTEGVNKLVALKITTPEDDRPPHSSRHELRILEMLTNLGVSEHNLVHILDNFESDGIDLVMVFPYFPFTLTQFLKHNSTKTRQRNNPYMIPGNDYEPLKATYENNLTVEQGKQIMVGIAEGLSFLHQHGIIHRDIKPANIMFKDFSPNPVIIDLGISFVYPNNYGKETNENKICDISTGIYKAPELLFRITDYSFGVDIWSFGILSTSLFSKNAEPIFGSEDVSDLKLASLIFNTFGTPTLESWPEAKKSKTFSLLQLSDQNSKDIDDILPRADNSIKTAFKKMMVYESKERISARGILDLLN